MFTKLLDIFGELALEASIRRIKITKGKEGHVSHFFFTLSFFLSLSHTRAHAHTHARTHTRAHTHTHTHTHTQNTYTHRARNIRLAEKRPVTHPYSGVAVLTAPPLIDEERTTRRYGQGYSERHSAPLHKDHGNQIYKTNTASPKRRESCGHRLEKTTTPSLVVA